MSFLRLGGAGKFPGFKILGDVVLRRLSSGLLSRLYTTYEAVSQNHVDGFDLKITTAKVENTYMHNIKSVFRQKIQRSIVCA